jgi:hypothetical protein
MANAASNLMPIHDAARLDVLGTVFMDDTLYLARTEG